MAHSIALELAAFVRGLEYGAIPVEVTGKAKELALHSWAVQAACSTLPWSEMCLRYVRSEYAPGPATVVVHGDRTSISGAALANGAFGHGFELDDNHAPTTIKAGCLTVPAGLAVAEARGSTGQQFLTAVVAGYEVVLRLGLAAWPGLRSLTFQPTGALGAVAAAVTAGKLMALDESAIAHAIGAALVSPVGSTEAPPSGRGELKRAFGGLAASAGVRAALLADLGLEGPITLTDAFAQRAYGVRDLGTLTDHLGTRWELLNVHYKIWAQDGFIQPVTEGLSRIVAAHPISVDEIDEVRIGTSRHAAERVIGKIRTPVSIADAQFSASFSAALFLCTGAAGITEYTSANLTDRRILALSEKVWVDVDPEVESDYQARRPRGAKVSVRLRDGRAFQEHVRDLRPVGPDELLRKARTLAALNLRHQAVDDLVDAAAALESLPDLSDIGRALARRA